MLTARVFRAGYRATLLLSTSYWIIESTHRRLCRSEGGFLDKPFGQGPSWVCNPKSVSNPQATWAAWVEARGFPIRNFRTQDSCLTVASF